MAEAKIEAKVEAESKETVDLNKQRIEALEKENAALLKETIAKKEQIRDLEAKKTVEEQERLKEQNKWKELYEGILPKAKRLEELEPVLTTLLEQEIADIPEDKRELIPNFDKPEQRLSWVKNAKIKGLFKTTEQGKTQPASTVQSKVQTDGTLPDYVSWASNDPRLTKLTLQEFQIWKRHNQKSAQGIKGWGNT